MIDTEALRKKVIDLAIQGKLTEQLPSDGDAETLYAQIQDHKSQLIKEGKIKKDNELPEISTDEIPFEIPDNWKWVRLGDLCLQITDGTHRTPAYQNDGIPFLSVKNISSGEFDLTDIKYISEEEHSELIKRCKPEKNDVLVCRIGTLGKAITIDIDLEFSIFVSLGLVKTTEKTVSDYIVQVINSGYGDSWIKDNKAGGAMHTYKINLNSLALLPVPLAPKSEIERILQLKDEVKKHIENINNLQSKYSNDLAVLKSKIIDAGIQGKLTEQLPSDGDAETLYTQIQEEKKQQIQKGLLRKTRGFNDITDDMIPFSLPNRWKVCYIDDVAFVTKLAGFEYTQYIADSICDEGIPLFKGKNIQKGELVLEFESYIPHSVSDELPRSKVCKKCLLTPYVGTIGNIALFNGEFDAHLGSNVGKIEILNPTKICLMEEYLLYYLRSSIGYSELTKHKKATAQDSISIDAIRNVIISIPPIEEQKRIVKMIDELLQIIG